MNNNGHNNQPCDFSESLVSYIYGEIGARESTNFQMHLVHCSECAAELAGFNVTRSSIAEWRDEEFSSMVLPVIELPKAVIQSAAVPSFEPSLIEKLRALLTFSPGFALAGLAAIVLSAGLVIAFLNFPGSNNFVASNRPLDEKTPVIANSAGSPTRVIDHVPTVAKVQPEITEDKKAAAPQPARATNAAKNVRRESEARITKVSDSPAPQTRQRQLPKRVETQQARSLSSEPDDYEDDSLRLADLFADADTF